jgi:uncharacterized membrane protein (DUF2068 family)
MWPFSNATPVEEKPDDQIRNRDIMSDDRTSQNKYRWTRLLIFYLRGLALLCIVRGLMDWARILGFVGEETAFETAPLAWQATIVLYAVLNCVAAVGLWLTSAWGAVLWLIVTLCEVFLPWAVVRTVRSASVADIFLLSLALLYVVLTWLSAREREKASERR